MRKVDYTDKVWDEVIATRIFHLIHKGEVAYASGIAKKLNANTQTVNNYISGLKDRNLIKEKERVRGKIIYEAHTQDLAESFVETIIEEVRKNKSSAESQGFTDYSEELDSVIKNLSDQKTRIESVSLIEDYLDELMSHMNPDSQTMSLADILKFELSFSIMRYYYNNWSEERFPDWFEDLTKAIIYSQINGWSLDILEDVMEDRIED